MKPVSRMMLGTLAAGAMVLASASPAMARDRDRGGIDGGDILAGALIVGGIAAAVAIASDNDRDDRRYRHRDYRYGNYRNNGRNNARFYQGGYQQAVNMCTRAAESAAGRYNYGTRGQVYRIRDVSQKRDGYKIKGNIAVEQRGRSYQRSRRDDGKFTCDVRHGRIANLKFSGIRGL